MQSYHNINAGSSNNLAPEDVEFLMQRYATDIVSQFAPIYAAGYDQWNGWGRINAAATMNVLQKPNYKVFHSGVPSSTQQTNTGSQIIILDVGINGLSSGLYNAERIEVTHTYSDVFSPSTQILDSWQRNSSGIGYSGQNPVEDNPYGSYSFVVNGNSAAVTATTSCWHVTSSVGGSPNLNVYIPAPPTALKTAYSLHLFDPNLTTANTDIQEKIRFDLFPVPTRDQVTVRYDSPNNKPIEVNIYNLYGQTVYSDRIPSGNNQEQTISVRSLPAGVYTCRLSTKKRQVFRKLVIQ